MRSSPGCRRPCPAVAAMLVLATSAGIATASPLEYLPVGDPLVQELRLLELSGPRDAGARLALPHLGTQPLQRFELQGPGPAAAEVPALAVISYARLERALGRDAAERFAPDPGRASTPRLFERVTPAGERLELSAGAEGALRADGSETEFLSGSGLHARLGVQAGRWLLFAHVLAGRVERGRTFADPIVAGTDLIVHTDETYVGYTGAVGRWAAQFGRSRWHWGPGAEGSLILSGTSAPLTGLSAQLHLPAWRLDAVALSATLQETAGEQLAAHRLEWQPLEPLRLGVTEAARYHASSWQPLYAAGAIPYVLVQRLLVQDEPAAGEELRNNILFGLDAAWRIAPGTRVYGEVVVDDLHARTSSNPDKYGWQLGWEGAGLIGARRLSWGGEWTRLSRYVYTSFFGRAYAAQGLPLGFPDGPDSRRIALRGAVDFGPDWQALARVSQVDKGENGLDEPYVPGSPRPDVASFEGVVERTRDAQAGLRWWPASGVDVRALAGYRWVDDLSHVPGATERHAHVTLEVRLIR